MEKAKENKKRLLSSANAVTILTVLIAAVLCVILVVFAAKKLFASNSREVPVGLDTATIAAAVTNIPEVQEQPEATTLATEAAVSESVTTASAEPGEMYVITYVQLLAEPREDAAHIICMSPNIKVTVLERLSDGYVKLTFVNGDGSACTGYVMNTYLSPTPVERETTAASESEAPAEEVPAEE